MSEVLERDVEVGTIELTSGETLHSVVQRVTLYGAAPRPDGSNVVFAPHALTGSSRVADWWDGIFGPGALFDPARWCIAGVNALGGCYGSTGPTSLAPDGTRWGPRFPVVTVADMVEAQRRALAALGVERFGVIIGGSLGGFQTLQWVRAHGDRVAHAIVVGAYDHLRAQGIAQNGAARDAIALDPAFRGGWYDAAPVAGLRLARAIATLTYKSEYLFEARFANRPDRKGGDPSRRLDDRFDVEGYLDHQGDLFAARIDANSYRTLTRAMDLFDLRGREAPAGPTRLTFVGIAGDQLYPPEHVWSCAARWAEAGWDAGYRHQHSDHGHDAFLAEPDQLAALLRDELARGAEGASSCAEGAERATVAACSRTA
ncbi:homoserine O-acetyltransferase [Vulcanimicrobium alpinum]|uniref:Homoserine O-acetyltransferase n=1 Tax=Vulcanimicrobium alpinum TaxID=3016050 RepID=A0AAN2CAT3_UNVUL|nr:homoserine O-acetyltransferase [Vulcanimicrobium alpinum]BDE07451.1 homoserine O-acetyltransferase [Vulcanimicrobium alpinum]